MSEEELISEIEKLSEDWGAASERLTGDLGRVAGILATTNGALEEAKSRVTECVQGISGVLDQMNESVEAGVEMLCSTLETSANEHGEALREHVESVADEIAERASGVLQERLNPCWEGLEEMFSQLAGEITESAAAAIGELTERVEGHVQKMGGEFRSHIAEMFDDLRDRLRGECSGNQTARVEGDRAREEMNMAFEPMQDIVDRVHDLADDVGL